MRIAKPLLLSPGGVFLEMPSSMETNMENISLKDRLQPLSQEEIEQIFNACVDVVARRLIGIFIFNNVDGRPGGRIIETEAYCENDPAAHCNNKDMHLFKGSDPMHRPGGYVYRHHSRGWCLNLTSGSPDKKFGSAVLVRALQPSKNDLLFPDRNLSNGPVKLCRHLRIDNKQYNDMPLWETSLELFKYGNGNQEIAIKCGKRIGIRKENKGASWPRNYIIDDDSLIPFLSPGSRRDLRRETYPPALLQEMKCNGPLAECVRGNGCTAK